MKSFKSIALVAALLLVLVWALHVFKEKSAELEAFNKHEKLVAETNECLEASEWNCAEKSVRALLEESPDDKNLHLHLAGILYEQERYDDCIEYVESLGYESNELDFLKQKSELLKQEMATLGLERSAHFRLEFEGRPSRRDVTEALAVLEVAYDSLCRLFGFSPENKMHLVLYQSAEYQGIGPRPDWVGAVYDGKLRVPVNVMEYPQVYRPMFFHELTHAFVRAMTRAKVPLWVNEGIAQVIDASRSNKPRPSGGVPSLDALTEPFVKEADRGSAEKLYWYSERMVRQMLNRNGSFENFREFVQSLRRQDIDKALNQYYSVSARQLLDEAR